MCSRCWEYLAPEAWRNGPRSLHGADSGRGRQEWKAYARRSGRADFGRVQIEVNEDVSTTLDSETKDINKTWKVEVSWGCGGTDGTRDEIVPGQSAENFANAIDHAVMLAKIWKMERTRRKGGITP